MQVITAAIDRFVIQNGFTEFSGAGIINSGTLVLHNSFVRNNTCWCNNWFNSSSDGGGGIANYGTLTVNNSTITGNYSSLGGAGLFNYNGTLTVNNSTISGNEGGSAVASFSTVVMNGSTVSGNARGGIFFDKDYLGRASTFTIQNTLVAGNWAANGADCWGPITSAGYNLIGNNSGCTFAAATGDKIGTSASPIDPRLTILQNNGGLTLTHALLTGSPAIDAGNPAVPGSGGNACPATDQQGTARPAGTRCDIGAYEGSVLWTLAPLVNTYTANNGSSLPGMFVCNQSSPNCSTGDSHAQAAHQYAIGTYNLYAVQYGRNGIDNKGMTITSTVHYKSNYDNAFWNGEQMVYGDAYGFPLADDVVAHELTHGVTQDESNLFYYYQSGAINESLSDLWGEYYDQTNGRGNDADSVRWQIGEDISGLGALRDMSNPWRYGDPEKMSSIYYYTGEGDNGGIHHNSGVNNRAVSLMVDGGDANGRSVLSLGWEKTAAIYYEANTKLLTSGSDYSDLYYALLQACSNLIGQRQITADNCAEVKSVLDAVEMNGQPVPNFNTNAPMCAAGYVPNISFADNLEAGIGKWRFTNGSDPRWQLDSPYGSFAQSGLHFLYADDYPAQVTDATARLTSFVVPSNAYLHFAQAYDFETGYNTGDPTLYNFDGGVLEYSINNGSTWVDAGSLMDFNGYKGTIYNGYNNPLKGRSAFVGASHGYISTRLNLASLAGKTVSFRWRMGLDGGVSAWGWWVDNIKMYTCLPLPGAFNKIAPTNGSIGFGLSTTLSWSSSSGANYYQYCYDMINDNQCNGTWSSHLTSTSVNISNLELNTTYYWQVRAVNAVGMTYANNQSWGTFTTIPLPGAFNKISPPNGVIGMSLNTTLSWASSSYVTSYQYCYDVINDNQCNRTWSSAGSATFVNIANLGANTAYYWQVRAVNIVGTTYADNQTWGSFMTSTLPAGTTGIDAFIGTTWQGKYSLSAGQSLRESYTGVNNGPVKIVSTNSIPLIGAERVIYKVNNNQTSFTEMMALPDSQLGNTYWLPWYNNVDLDTQLRFGNVSETTAHVHIYIGTAEMTGSPFTLEPGQSTRQSFAGINNGPVKIESDQNIVAAERVIYIVNGVPTSFSEMMGLPNSQLNTTYWFPWYNNVDLDTQLRFGNVSGSTAHISVTINNVPVDGSPFALGAGQSQRVSFLGVNTGPVKVDSDVPIVAAERVIYKIGGVPISFSELMGVPNSQLNTTYWMPWYNNVDLDTQLRFGNVSGTDAHIHVFIGGSEMTSSPYTLTSGESQRVSFAGVNNGPVQIVSDVPIVAAERVIYKVNGVPTSFSEMLGLPNSQLNATYWMPWYNNVDLDTQLRFGVP